MAEVVIADSGFVVALLNPRDAQHEWAIEQAKAHPHPWITCEAVLSECFHILENWRCGCRVRDLLARGFLQIGFHLGGHLGEVLALMQKYEDVPMDFADACLVRMSELLPNPVILATDSDFRVYRRHGRRVIPCVLPV